MERILHYEIKASDDSPTVACFLKRQGYSSANLTDLKKMPEMLAYYTEKGCEVKNLAIYMGAK